MVRLKEAKMKAYIELKVKRAGSFPSAFEGEFSYVGEFAIVENEKEEVRIPWENVSVIIMQKPAHKPIEYGPVGVECAQGAADED